MEQSVVVEQENNPELKSKTHFKGKVLKTSLAGALVDIGLDKPGILHVSRITSVENAPIHRVEDVLKEGQEVEILFHADKCINEEIQNKVSISKLLNSIPVIMILSCVILLSSCTIFFRAHGHRGHGVSVGQVDRHEHHDS